MNGVQHIWLLWTELKMPHVPIKDADLCRRGIYPVWRVPFAPPPKQQLLFKNQKQSAVSNGVCRNRCIDHIDVWLHIVVTSRWQTAFSTSLRAVIQSRFFTRRQVQNNTRLRGRVLQRRPCIFHQSAEISLGGENNGTKLVGVRGVMQPFCPRRRAGCIATKEGTTRLTKARATLTLRAALCTVPVGGLNGVLLWHLLVYEQVNYTHTHTRCGGSGRAATLCWLFVFFSRLHSQW